MPLLSKNETVKADILQLTQKLHGYQTVCADLLRQLNARVTQLSDADLAAFLTETGADWDAVEEARVNAALSTNAALATTQALLTANSLPVATATVDARPLDKVLLDARRVLTKDAKIGAVTITRLPDPEPVEPPVEQEKPVEEPKEG